MTCPIWSEQTEINRLNSSGVQKRVGADDRFPIEWKDEGEKSLMWFYDDLHCPNPISPLYFDIGGWWDCDGRWGADCT